MARREVLKSDDREVIFARFTTYSSDLREESHHFSTFILSGDLPACAGAIMDHVHSVLDLRVPFAGQVPTSDHLIGCACQRAAKMATCIVT